MALDTATAVAALRDLTATFDRTVTAANPFYPTVSTVVQSTGADEKYGWLGAMPGMREWLGERKFKELRGTTYELTNKHWESSLNIRKTDISDSRMGLYGAVMQDLANEAAHHPDELLSSVLVAGETATGHDGQSFFDTDHSWGDSGTQSNDLTSDVTTTSAPTATEFRTAFRASVTALLGFKNDQGKPLVRPLIGRMDNLIAMVPPNMRDAAHEAFESTIISNSSNVVIDRPTIVVNPYLTATAKFYTFYVGGSLKPFVFQAREPLSRDTKGLDDLETKFVKFMTEARYNLGYLAWWNATLTTLT